MSEMNLLSIFNMVEAQDRLMTCPGECRDSLQHQKKQEKKHWQQSLHKRKHLKRCVSGSFCSFFCLVGKVWTFVTNVAPTV